MNITVYTLNVHITHIFSKVEYKMKKNILKTTCLIAFCMNSLCAMEGNEDLYKASQNTLMVTPQPSNEMKHQDKEYDQILPNEILFEILSNLDDKTLIQLYPVSHQFEDVVTYVWNHVRNHIWESVQHYVQNFVWKNKIIDSLQSTYWETGMNLGRTLYFISHDAEVPLDHTPALKKIGNDQYKLFSPKVQEGPPFHGYTFAFDPDELNIDVKDLNELWDNKGNSKTKFLPYGNKLLQIIMSTKGYAQYGKPYSAKDVEERTYAASISEIGYGRFQKCFITDYRLRTLFDTEFTLISPENIKYLETLGLSKTHVFLKRELAIKHKISSLNLIKLDLRYNLIKKNLDFSALTRLTELNLSWNKINDTYIDYLKIPASLKELDLSGNQLSDEKMQGFRAVYKGVYLEPITLGRVQGRVQPFRRHDFGLGFRF